MGVFSSRSTACRPCDPPCRDPTCPPQVRGTCSLTKQCTGPLPPSAPTPRKKMLQEAWAQPDKGDFPLPSLTLLLRERNGRETLLLWLLFSSLLKGLLFCAAAEGNQSCVWCVPDLRLKSRTCFSQLRTRSFSAGCGWRRSQPSPQSS